MKKFLWSFALVCVLLLVSTLVIIRIYPPMRHGYTLLKLLNEDPPQRLLVPVEGVKSEKVSDTWGSARSGGRKHEGVDIFAKRNTPVISNIQGVVMKKGWNDFGGTTITVMGSGGYFHYYAHLDSYGKYETGDLVNVNDTLGYIGNTGNARTTPPHLHYGIYTKGVAINPYPLLK